MALANSILFTSLLSTLVAAVPTPDVLRAREVNLTAVTFASVVPSSKINWVPCYGPKLQCTYLTVPLDYKNTSAGTTDVAFIRYLISEDIEDLLFNPGGPGESGIEHLVDSGEQFAKRWGYNPVSFDPRGVKWTAPNVACSYNKSSTLEKRQIHPLGDLKKDWNEILEKNHACSLENKNTNAKYVGTYAIVQDMMHFTELQAAARGKDPKTALINYYGVSYGTLVGQTLVAAYPDRIKRVLLDANVYGVAHYQGWEPSGNDDIAHFIFLFSKLCFEAGDDWCVLAAGANSTEEVHARFDRALEILRLTPLKLDGKPFDDNAFLQELSGSMYNPRRGFRTIANLTASVLIRNASGAKVSRRDIVEPKTSDTALDIITSVDIAGRYPWKTYAQWKEAADKLASTLPYGAYGYATGLGSIGAGMSIIPPPSQLFPGFKAIRPRASVLFVNTVADHVTPTASARQMSKLFAGSGVVIVNGPGHGYTTSPSRCSNAIISKYMKDGTVPEKETLCEPDAKADYYFGAKAEAWTLE
ncbi:hypothetical protein CC86DRAFT_362654 [Ophiobolus disseminans]|uniref:Peptidase S33 tripeptidyl aminopeptidase-like C-terminal domain-containing protein n=1 Tax=Ophiobolus disseminans TaxID=1469910 RepID=A0A6A6ZG16_9PLEO|nr:hypothetical protein CC86DRAFT_362654 [Ophiobolus disseminans]